MVLSIQETIGIKQLLGKLYLKKISYKHLRAKKEIEDDLLMVNDELWLDIFGGGEIDLIPEDISVDIVYEDDFLLIVNKPRGILVHPDSKDKKGTLANRVANYYMQNNINAPIRPLNRLDFDTSGLMIFSKVSLLQGYFDSLIKDKNMLRKYYAVVSGYYRKKQKFEIDAPIGRDRHDAHKFRISQTGKKALTKVICIDSSRENNVSLIKLELNDERTHQIRVHMANHKHPILGDKLYNEKYNKENLALMCYSIEINSFIYPDGLNIELPIDDYLQGYFESR